MLKCIMRIIAYNVERQISRLTGSDTLETCSRARVLREVFMEIDVRTEKIGTIGAI